MRVAGFSVLVVRISNVRVNASEIGLSTTLIPNQVVMTVAVNGTQAPVVDNPQQTMAYIQAAAVSQSTGPQLSQCADHNTPVWRDRNASL